MKKLLLPVLAATLTLTACKKTEEVKTNDTFSETIIPENQPAQDTMAVAGDNTQTSVDWNGTYKGTIPCASCPGIETTLTLNNDKTYTLESNYLEEKDGKTTDKGTFEFDSTGSFFTLKNAADAKDQKIFFVGEGNVWMVTKVGDREMKDEYKLVKQ